MVWDDPAVDWGRFDRVVVRSAWDYTFKRDEFLAWADSLDGRLQNPPDAAALEQRQALHGRSRRGGLPVVETQFSGPGRPAARRSRARWW